LHTEPLKAAKAAQALNSSRMEGEEMEVKKKAEGLVNIFP